MKKYVAVTVALVLLVGVGGFFGGMTYQKSVASSTGVSPFAGGMGPGGRFGWPGVQRDSGNQGNTNNSNSRNGQGFRGGGAVAGEIIEKDASSITIKMQDGSTKIVMVSSSATISKASKGSKNDLKKGENVMVMGTTNSDGSVTATNINVGEFRFGRPPGSGSDQTGTQPNQTQNQ